MQTPDFEKELGAMNASGAVGKSRPALNGEGDFASSSHSVSVSASPSASATDVPARVAGDRKISEDFETYRAIMQKGSKTFSMAARLFDQESRMGAMLLYSWCRYCDDAIDAASDQEAALDALDHLKIQTERALDPLAPSPIEPAFRALREISVRYAIPSLYPIELLNGMEMDTAGIRIRTTADLKLYCYRVASVVGLMMTQIMGITDRRALRHAVDTGLAMQMTNIARDISDDYNMKRIYIPDAWFDEQGYQRPNFENRELFVPQLFTESVKHLLTMADKYYASGRQGIQYLPWRAAFAVASAQRIYREIGVRILKKHDQAWFSRTYVPLGRKLVLMMVAVADVVWIKTRANWAPKLTSTRALKTPANRGRVQSSNSEVDGSSLGLVRDPSEITTPLFAPASTGATGAFHAQHAPESASSLELRDNLFRAHDL